MNQTPEFNKTFNLRTVLMSAVSGWLASSKLNIPAEQAVAVAAIAGYVYDIAAFWLKKKWLEAQG